MKSIEVLNEVKPKFPPKVQAIWEECGTYIESINAVVAADELEHFVDTLLESIALDFDPKQCKDYLSFREFLTKKGYL